MATFFFLQETWKIYKCKWMVLGALGCMNNDDFGENISKWHIAYHAHFLSSVSAFGIHFDAILRRWSVPLKSYGWSIFLSLFLPVTQAVSIPFCTMLDLQLLLYHPLCCNSRAHSPLLQCLCTISAIFASANFYLVVSSFKCDWKNRCHDLIPNPRNYCILWWIRIFVLLKLGHVQHSQCSLF